MSVCCADEVQVSCHPCLCHIYMSACLTLGAYDLPIVVKRSDADFESNAWAAVDCFEPSAQKCVSNSLCN